MVFRVPRITLSTVSFIYVPPRLHTAHAPREPSYAALPSFSTPLPNIDNHSQSPDCPVCPICLLRRRVHADWREPPAEASTPVVGVVAAVVRRSRTQGSRQEYTLLQRCAHLVSVFG